MQFAPFFVYLWANKTRLMVKIIPIEGRENLKKFVRFKIKLYRGNKYAVPPLVLDEVNTLNPKTNPAFEFCESQCFLAYDGKKIVGRICVMINHRANEVWDKKEARFGFFDFIDDFEVAKALLDAAQIWAKERAMTAMHGPLGFTDLDEEGWLVEGYEELGTMASLYNYAYYIPIAEKLGLEKAVDWVEYKVTVPYPKMNTRIDKIATIVEQKCGVRMIHCKNGQDMIRTGWGTKIFELINVAYAPLYGFSALTQKQIDHYVKLYLPMVRMELITLVADSNDNLVGFGIGLPSLSRAFQKAQGRMLPFGWFYMLRALKRKKVAVVDLMLTAVHPDYQNKGITALIMRDTIHGMQKLGAKYSETNPELESNGKMQGQWDEFEHVQHKRRRAFTKPIV